jgi:hypothetical protein
MQTIKLNNYSYILANYILENAPIYSKGIRSGKDLIRKKIISNDNYIFARFVDNKWIPSDGKSAKFDKVLIKYDLVDKIDELQGRNTTDDNGVEQAPDIIQLENYEKFQDDNGNIIKIETRGKRNVDNIYFKVKDVATGFGMENLSKSLLKEDRGYFINKDYKYFICEYGYNVSDSTCKTTDHKSIVKKELFLTYQGILRVLFVSRNNKTDKFIRWATEKLFTIQMGTKEQKNELVSNILGVNARVIKEVFNTSTNTLPCIYLFTLNTVKELRQNMDIDNKYPDDSIVCKYGFTKDLSRRTAEHIDSFKNINNCDLKLKYHAYIDPQYISKGETDIKQIMEAFNVKFNYKNYDELVIISKDLLKIVQKQYEQIGKSYMGHISELVTKIKELEDKYEKQELKHQLELDKVKYNLELQKEKYENELLKKEVEILKLLHSK